MTPLEETWNEMLLHTTTCVYFFITVLHFLDITVCLISLVKDFSIIVCRI